jgi:hypothetical protein
MLRRELLGTLDRKCWRIVALASLKELYDGRHKPLGDDPIHDQFNVVLVGLQFEQSEQSILGQNGCFSGEQFGERRLAGLRGAATPLRRSRNERSPPEGTAGSLSGTTTNPTAGGRTYPPTSQTSLGQICSKLKALPRENLAVKRAAGLPGRSRASRGRSGLA